MDILQNRIVAGFLCLLIIIVFSVVGVASTLMPMRAQVTELFHTGERGAPGVASDLSEISAQAFNLTVIAGRYLAPEYPGTARVLNARENLTQSMQGRFSPREMRRAKDELIGAAQILESSLNGLELTAQDQNLMATVMVEINSRSNLISQSSYNQAAFAFNQSLGRFPANILGPAAGVRPLELFE